MLFALTYVVLGTPYALLTLAAALLWRRRRTFATLLSALGFGATLIGVLAGFFVSHEMTVVFRSHQDPSVVLTHHHHIFPLLTHYITISGFWAAAVGMLWHATANR